MQSKSSVTITIPGIRKYIGNVRPKWVKIFAPVGNPVVVHIVLGIGRCGNKFRDSVCGHECYAKCNLRQ